MRARAIRMVCAVAATSSAIALPAGDVAARQSVSVRAYVTPGTTVGVGRPFVLNLEVNGAQSVDGQPVAPDFGAAATYLGSSSSSSMQMVNGRTTVSLTLQYRYQALEEGTLTVPAIDVPVGGRTLRTEPVELDVSAAPPPTDPSNDPSVTGEVPPEDLFITAEPSRTEVLAGEPFTVEYRIWTRVDVGGYSLTHAPEPEGFWVEEIEVPGQPQVEQVVRDGRAYATAVIRRLALVPTGAGERTLEPIGVEAQVRVQRRTNDPFDRIFGRSSIFGTTRVPTIVLSNPVTVRVRPLPPGQPEPFSGVVGSLGLSASLDRTTVDANDAVTLAVRVDGEGNVRAVPAPELELPSDFEVFPPDVAESVESSAEGLRGSKTFEYVLIPRAPGDRSIPEIAMGYYDVEAGAYRTARTGPLALTVTGQPVDGPAALARGGVATLRRDIRFIRIGRPRFVPVGRTPFTGAGFWLFLMLPMAAVGGAAALRRHRDRLEGDVAYARERRAGRVARKRLGEASRLAGETDSRAFYAEVARALRGYAADRLNVAEAGMQTDALADALSGRGVSDATVAELQACLEHCDRQRFAPPSGDTEAHDRMVERAAAAMTALAKELGR